MSESLPQPQSAFDGFYAHLMVMAVMPKITRKQLAELQGVSVETVRNWEREKIIPFIKVGNVIRFDLEKVEKALEKFERKVGV